MGKPASAGLIRGFDIILAIIAIVIVSPILAIIALIVFVTDGRPVLFKQDRAGMDEQNFRILKFRTLRNSLKGGLSGTKIGQFLRTTSLDELPQLFNILRGDMSFVGPRPLLPEYSEYFSEVERTRFAVRPGLTGLAQISGRNSVSWDDKLAIDVCFVREYSVRQYLRILITTPSVVIRRHGSASTWNEETRLDVERRNRPQSN